MCGCNEICCVQADVGGVRDEGAWSMDDWEDKMIDNLLNFAGTPKVSDASTHNYCSQNNFFSIVREYCCFTSLA